MELISFKTIFNNQIWTKIQSGFSRIVWETSILYKWETLLNISVPRYCMQLINAVRCSPVMKDDNVAK